MSNKTYINISASTALIFFIFQSLMLAQINVQSNQTQVEKNIKSNNFYLSLEGGFTQGFTDYKNQVSSSVFRLGTEYNFHPLNGINLGFGLRGGLGNIDGKDNRQRISTNDGMRNIPTKISTKFFEIGLFTTLGIDIFEVVSPYLMFSASYFNFSPQLDNGEEAAFNKAGIYENTIANIGFGGGMRYSITNALSVYVQGEFFNPNTDYLDDVSASKSKDSYLTFTLGVSYNFLKKKESEIEFKKLTTPVEIIQKPEETKVPAKEDSIEITEPLKPKEITEEETTEPEEEDFGIMVEEMVLSADDLFQSNSAKFKEGANKQLDDVVKFLKKKPETRWRIEGHMDSQGAALYIKRISYDRAKAVLDYFISQGLDQSRFEIYGLADNFPIANNLTEEGRKQNRRIRIVLQK